MRIPSDTRDRQPAVRESRIVAALVRDRHDLARLQSALRPSVYSPHGATLSAFTELSVLERALEHGVFDVLVIEPTDDSGRSTESAIQRFRSQYPAMSILGHVVLKSGLSSAVLSFARAGVHELVFAGIDDSAIVLRHALQRASRRCLAEEVMHNLSAVLPSEAIPLVRYCLEHVNETPGVDEMSAALGVHRRTLVKRMRSAMLPPPSELWAWSRLLLAARYLESPGRSVDWIAATTGYPSANALRNSLKKYTGLVPGELRSDSGFARVLVIFRGALLADSRQTETQRPSPRPPATYVRVTGAAADSAAKAERVV
jgi:AraC-like DNA-binding protein